MDASRLPPRLWCACLGAMLDDDLDTVTFDGITHTEGMCLRTGPTLCGATSKALDDVTCALPAGHIAPHIHGVRPLRWWDE